jgi:hypothetical protein
MLGASRKQGILAAVALVLCAAVAVSAVPVQSFSTGIDSSLGGVGAPPARGCYCHSADGVSKDPNGDATISFAFEGLDAASTNGYYQASRDYNVVLTFDDAAVPMNPSPTANKGGFNVWASGGTFATGGSDLVLVNTDGSITHTIKGDQTANRSFAFVWKSPATNETDVTFDVLVNAVNGDGANTGGSDHWSRMVVTLPGLPGAGGAGGDVDISKLGVPLRAYWLGVIGILATIFLLVLSFYVIRSGSKFYEFGLPRGQVKNVKVRTIPAPKTRGSYLTMAGLAIILILIVVTFLGVRDEDLSPMQATGFLLSVVFVIALMAAYYIRAFLPLVDVLEEETVEAVK